jgi:hypothetical protein
MVFPYQIIAQKQRTATREQQMILSPAGGGDEVAGVKRVGGRGAGVR